MLLWPLVVDQTTVKQGQCHFHSTQTGDGDSATEMCLKNEKVAAWTRPECYSLTLIVCVLGGRTNILSTFLSTDALNATR